MKGKKRTNRRLRHYSRLRTRRTGTKMRSRPKTTRRRRLRTQKKVRQRFLRKGTYAARGGRTVNAAAVAGLKHAHGQGAGSAYTSDKDADTSTVSPSLVKAHSGADIVGAFGNVIGPLRSQHSKETQERKQGYFTSVTKPTLVRSAGNILGAGGVMAMPTIKNLVNKGVGALRNLLPKATSTEAGPDSIGSLPEKDTPTGAGGSDVGPGDVDPEGDPVPVEIPL